MVTAQCVAQVHVGRNKDPEGSESRNRGGGSGSSSPRTCSYQGLPVVCESASGSWNSAGGDWCRLAPNPPPKSDPIWGGSTSGAIYVCTRSAHPGLADRALTVLRWLPGPPELAPPDPEELARRLLASIDFQAPQLGIYPRADVVKRMGYVGWNTWLWADPSSQLQWGPVADSISERGVTVTLTAKVVSVDWDLGDGGSLSCGKGTPWAEAKTGGRNVPSPDCGYVYEADGRYTVTATSNWAVSWQGGGRSGELPFTLSRSQGVIIGELQTLVTQR